MCVELDDGARRYVVTWGRIQGPVDPRPLEELVLRHSHQFSLGGTAVSARVCETMREAAMSDQAPYFYECFLEFSSHTIPTGAAYDEWHEARALAMEAGREISYCGRPRG